MAGLSGDPFLEFHVLRVPGGVASTHIEQQMQVGDSVKVSGPLGAAYLRAQHTGPILCVAGASGLAPILSVVRGAIAAGMSNRFLDRPIRAMDKDSGVGSDLAQLRPHRQPEYSPAPTHIPGYRPLSAGSSAVFRRAGDEQPPV